MMCGLPCSGKSRHAQQLKHDAEAKGMRVHLIRDDSFGFDRSVYGCTPNYMLRRVNLILPLMNRFWV